MNSNDYPIEDILKDNQIRVNYGTVSYLLKMMNGRKVHITKRISGEIVEESTVCLDNPLHFCDLHSVWKDSCSYDVMYRNGIMTILNFRLDDNNILINNIGSEVSESTNIGNRLMIDNKIWNRLDKIGNNPYRGRSIEDGSLDVTNSPDYQRAYRIIMNYEEKKLKEIDELLNRIYYSIRSQLS